MIDAMTAMIGMTLIATPSRNAYSNCFQPQHARRIRQPVTDTGKGCIILDGFAHLVTGIWIQFFVLFFFGGGGGGGVSLRSESGSWGLVFCPALLCDSARTCAQGFDFGTFGSSGRPVGMPFSPSLKEERNRAWCPNKEYEHTRRNHHLLIHRHQHCYHLHHQSWYRSNLRHTNLACLHRRAPKPKPPTSTCIA